MEVLGIAGTLFIIAAFLQKGERRIRILDAVGALLFIVYGVTIKSFSTIVLNLLLVGIQGYKLFKMRGDL